MQGATGDLSAKCRVPASLVPCPAGPPLLINGEASHGSPRAAARNATLTGLNNTSLLPCA